MLLAATDPQLGLKCSEGRSLLPKMTESINSHLKSSNLDSFELFEISPGIPMGNFVISHISHFPWEKNLVGK